MDDLIRKHSANQNQARFGRNFWTSFDTESDRKEAEQDWEVSQAFPTWPQQIALTFWSNIIHEFWTCAAKKKNRPPGWVKTRSRMTPKRAQTKTSRKEILILIYKGIYILKLFSSFRLCVFRCQLFSRCVSNLHGSQGLPRMICQLLATTYQRDHPPQDLGTVFFGKLVDLLYARRVIRTRLDMIAHWFLLVPLGLYMCIHVPCTCS